jgi:dCMP deaminase
MTKQMKSGVNHNDAPQEVREYIAQMSQYHVENQRPCWDITFMNIAHEIAKRSPDTQTKVGAVIVNAAKHIISVGYNGWMPGIDDDVIPNIRPYKHDWVIHAELNAILNCEHRPHNATLYCTHQPCIHCFSAIVVAGITELVYIDSSTTNTQDKKIEWKTAKYLVKDKISIRKLELENI